MTDILQLLMVGMFVSLSFFLIGSKSLQGGPNEAEYMVKGPLQNEITPLNSPVRVSISKLNQASLKKAILGDKLASPNPSLVGLGTGVNNKFAEHFQLLLFLTKIIFPFHYYW